MSAHRYPGSWRAINFNEHLDGSGVTDDPAHVNTQLQSYYLLSQLDMTRVETTDYRELRQWLEGAEANEAYEGVMLMLGDGQIHASSPADLEDRTAALRAAFSAASTRVEALDADPPGVLPFLFKRDHAGGALALQVFCRPSSGRPVIIPRRDEGLTRRFRFALVAFDARLYSQAETSVACAVAGDTVITTVGDMYTHPRFLIVSNNAATIKITIGPNSVTFAGLPTGIWTIDTRRSTITGIGGINGMQYRTAGFLSSLFLNAGANTVSTTGSANLTLVGIYWRDAYA